MVTREDAVSPVVGVMLMLVVTIIIAGAVTVFATGFMADTEKNANTPTAQLKFLGLDNGGYDLLNANGLLINGARAEIGLVFEHLAGDPVDLKNLMIEITSTSAGRTSVTYNDIPSEYWDRAATRYITLPAGFQYRMTKYPYPTSPSQQKQTIINPGERFIIFVEYVGGATYFGIRSDRLDPTESSGSGNAYSSGGYALTSDTTYVLSDETSGTILLKGNLGEGIAL